MRRNNNSSARAIRFAGWLIIASVAVPALADDAVVDRRQDSFGELKQSLKRIGRELKEEQPDWASLAVDADRAKELTRWLHHAFPQGSAAGSRAKERIWDDWSDFNSRLTRLSDATEGLAVAGMERDRQRLAGRLEEATGTCRGCHMEYRSLIAWPLW